MYQVQQYTHVQHVGHKKYGIFDHGGRVSSGWLCDMVAGWCGNNIFSDLTLPTTIKS